MMNSAKDMAPVVDLGLGGKPGDHRVVVAMSGGVDSSVTAALLAEAGYDVVGMTLQLYDDGAVRGRPGACCAGQDIYDARRVADRIGFPHYVLNYEDRFREAVVDDFADAYLRGETPLPCVRCNERVKFRDMLSAARELGAVALATGHYVQRVTGLNGPELHAAVERVRDQSYFLFATTSEQLDYLRFPLGDMAKDTVRAHAERLGLEIAGKPDSQDICFVPNGDYAAVIEQLRPGAVEPGEIVDVQGQVLGTHTGIINFTIGQRRGLGIAADVPLFVIALDAATRRVVVGPRGALIANRVVVREVNWLAGEDKATDRPVMVRIRSTHPGAPARLGWRSDGGLDVTLETPEPATAAGQGCVIYDGARVLGGGWISGMENSDQPVTEDGTRAA
jgi:tRNA-specific 2-thiouridylase